MGLLDSLSLNSDVDASRPREESPDAYEGLRVERVIRYELHR